MAHIRQKVTIRSFLPNDPHPVILDKIDPLSLSKSRLVFATSSTTPFLHDIDLPADIPKSLVLGALKLTFQNIDKPPAKLMTFGNHEQWLDLAIFLASPTLAYKIIDCIFTPGEWEHFSDTYFKTLLDFKDDPLDTKLLDLFLHHDCFYAFFKTLLPRHEENSKIINKLFSYIHASAGIPKKQALDILTNKETGRTTSYHTLHREIRRRFRFISRIRRDNTSSATCPSCQEDIPKPTGPDPGARMLRVSTRWTWREFFAPICVRTFLLRAEKYYIYTGSTASTLY
jgi:hypothetical protein